MAYAIKMVIIGNQRKRQTARESGTQSQTSYDRKKLHQGKNGRLPQNSVAVFDCHKLADLSIYGSQQKNFIKYKKRRLSMKVRKQLVTVVVAVMLIQMFSVSLVGFADESNLADVGYVGPGKYVADLLIVDQDMPQEEYQGVGRLSLWNTRDKLRMILETDPEWVIREVMIFVGDGEVPTTIGGAPKVEFFPYQEELAEPSHTYELTLDLFKDLEITWGRREEERRLPKISVCLRVEPVDQPEKGIQRAWAEGNKQFENGEGWWMDYAVVHPHTGHLIDAPVQGVTYQTPTHSGTTDHGGSFEYFDGEIIEFYLGSVFVGEARAEQRVTPMDIIGVSDTDHSSVVNMAKLLQSFDEDGEPNGGIDISSSTGLAFNQAAAELGVSELDYSDGVQIDQLIELTNAKKGGKLNVVSDVEALDNLEKGTNSNVVRKNVSKNSAFEDAKAKLEFMPMYVPAMKANGDPVTLNYYDLVFDEGTQESEYMLTEQRNVVKPLVACYAEELIGTDGFDIYGAVSRDAGETWQVQNLSKSADKSSFMTVDGVEFSGTCHKPQIRVRGNYILAAWTSKFGRTGNPRYALDYGDPYYEEDIWGVGGPQRSRDYTSDGYPEVGELPYSVVWTCRGMIDPATGEVTWYKPERLTSGRRDAFQLMQSGAEGAGFGVVWQEDPEGLRPGEMAGPGEGWSGATTNHKTDIWYSFIAWDDFTDIDEDFESNGVQKEDINEDFESNGVQKEDINEDQKGRPKAEVPFSLPVRISDNDTVNVSSMKVDETQIPGLDTLGEGNLLSVNSNNFVPVLEEGEEKGTHNYGYADLPNYYSGPAICDQLYFKVNNQEADKFVAITEDGRILDGNTGASRPNIMMQTYMTKDSTGKTKKSAWVVVCYEETKGAGSGPDDVTSASVDGGTGATVDDGTADPADEEPDPADEWAETGVNPVIAEGSGVGEQKGKDAYVPDNGKLVVYHTFDMAKPDLVSAGEIMNPQVLIDSQDDYDHYAREDGSLPGLIPSKGNLEPKEGNIHRGLLHLVDEAGELLRDFNNDPIPAYENARRPRLLIQGANGALGKSSTSAPAKWDVGTSLVMVYKMGEDGKGRPSDIMMRRWEITSAIKGSQNPYSTNYLSEDILNISATVPTEYAVNSNSSEDKSGDGIKVMRWEQPEVALGDATYANPYEDARAHRGILRGKNLAIAFDWTPNWAAHRNGNDIYNLYVRRSFDGGKTFTTNPKGTNEVYIDGVYQGIGVLHEDMYRTALGTGNERIEDDEIPKIVVESYWPKGGYEPAQNLSKLQNNKETVIEPRLVGGPSSTKVNGEVMYGEDQRNTNLFWVTYGTSSNPGDDSMEPKEPLDLYYSYTTDFGDSFYHETKMVNESSQGHYAGQEREVWPWLAKDTGKVESAQAECQIRMSPNGTVMYSVWNENGNGGGDVKFRRIMLDGKMIEADLDMVDLTPPFITISGIEDGDVRNEDVTIEIFLSELGSWEATIKEGTTEIVYAENPIEIAASDSTKAYVLDIEAEDLSGNVSFRHIAFTIDGKVPQIVVTGVENGEHRYEPIDLGIDTGDAEADILLMWNNVEMYKGPELPEPYKLEGEGRYELDVTASLGGYTAEKHMGFVIDQTPPEIRVEGVEDQGIYVNSAKPEVIVTDNFSQHLQELTILLNGEEYLSATRISTGGDYELYAKAVDRAGNIAEIWVEFSVEIEGTRYRIRHDETSVIEGTILAGEETTILFDTDYATLLVPAAEFTEDVTYRIEAKGKGDDSGTALKIGDEVYQIELLTAAGSQITSFEKPLILTFVYREEDLPVGVEESDIEICYWDENLNEWIVVPSNIDTEANMITAAINHLTVFSLMAKDGFPSLQDCENHWAKGHIYQLASLGICGGDQKGAYHPEDPITREELAKMLVNALNLESTSQMEFADNSSVSDWAKEYMHVALATGALELDGNQMARPQDYATRGDLIVAANAVFQLKDLGSGEMEFTDLGMLDTELQGTVRLLAQHGIMRGYGNGTIKPMNRILRGELAKMIAVYLKSGRQ
jgi:hypothetical protein